MATPQRPANPAGNGSRPPADPNALRSTRERAPRSQSTAVDRPGPRAAPDVASENALRPTKAPKRRRPAVEPVPGAAAAPRAAARQRPKHDHTIPEEIRKRFVQVGREYYFADGAPAFTDRGRRLTTPSENTEVIRSLVVIAQARGWDDVTVSGTERFRKEAWFAARLAGLAVRGYTASAFEQQRLVQLLARAAAKSMAPPRGGAPNNPDARPAERASRPPAEAANERPRRGALLTGKLIDHGRATYHREPHAAMSYFVKLDTPNGEREIWGVDLERALKESLTRPQIGEEVGLRAVRQDAVTVKSRERDATGQVIGEKELATHRNRWIVEKRDFFAARAEAARTVRDPRIEPRRAVQQYPELAGTYLNLHAAEIASRRLRDPQDQRRFVKTVRDALASAVARGEPLPPVRLRERPAARADAPPEREQARVRG